MPKLKDLTDCQGLDPAENYPDGFPQAYPVTSVETGEELIFFPNRCTTCDQNYVDRRFCPKFK